MASLQKKDLSWSNYDAKKWHTEKKAEHIFFGRMCDICWKEEKKVDVRWVVKVYELVHKPREFWQKIAEGIYLLGCVPLYSSVQNDSNMETEA